MGIAERKARERRQRSEAIIDAAEDLIFARGVDRVTMQQVADAVELNKATLYLYFSNKEDLLHAVIERGLQILIEMFEQRLAQNATGIETLTSLALAYLEFYRLHPDYHRALYHRERRTVAGFNSQEPTPHDLITDRQARHLFDLVGESIHRGIEDGSVRKSSDPRQDAVLFIAQLGGVVQTVDDKGDVLALSGVDPETVLDRAIDVARRYFLSRDR